MEADEAWDLFKAQASADLRKSASMAGQLDTLAAQMQDIQTGVNRLTTLIPKLMGDETAIDAANEDAAPPEPAPGMGMDMGGAPEDDSAPPMEGGEPEDEAIPDEEPPMEEDDMSKAEEEKPEDTQDTPEEAPAEETSEESEPAPEAPMEEESEADFIDEEPPVEEEMEEVVEEPEVTAEAPVETPAAPDGMEFYASLLALLVQAATKASQAGDSGAMASLTKSAGAMQSAYGELAPVLDGIFGTDTFTKSYQEAVGVENEMAKSCDSSDISGASHPDEMIEKSDVPAEVTDSPTDLEKCSTKMPDVEDEKGETPTDKTKVGPVNMEKSAVPQMRSFADMMKSRDPTPLMKSEASTKMPDVPENGEDMSVTGTASENMPDVPENGSDMSVTGTASEGVKPVIDPGSEKSELQKSDDSTPAQMEECGGAMAKSAQMPGKHLKSMRELMGGAELQKSAGVTADVSRPDSIYSAGGDVRTPEFGAPMQKSASPAGTSFREMMMSGATPEQVVANDWKQYNLFKAKGRY